jgi:signal transduction histidine kinase
MVNSMEPSPTGAFLLATADFSEIGPVIHSVSEGFLLLHGSSASALLGTPLRRLVVPSWNEGELRQLETSLQETSVLRERCRLLTATEGLVQVELEISRLVTRDGAAPLLHLAVLDADTRQSMASQIAGLVSSFDAVQSEVPMGTWELLPEEGWTTRYSPEALTVHGLSPEHAAEDPDVLTNCIHPADRTYVKQALEAAVQERKPIDLLYRAISPSCELRWIRLRATPLERTADRSYRVVGVVFDVTHRVKTTASLRDAEQRYQAAADASRDALAFLAPMRSESETIADFVITDVNRRACELFSRERAALVGRPIGQVVPLFRTAGLLERFAEVAECHEPFETTLRNHAEEMDADFIQLQAVPVGDGVAVYIRDVSAEKRLEAQLARAQRLESIGRMATGIAHDFNNMLSAINGFTTIARDGLTNAPDARDDLEQALIAAGRASRLTRYLLAFASRQPLSPERVSVNDVLKELSRILARILGNDVQLHLDLDPKVVAAWVDSSQLEQAIINLATNARDAMPRGGQLRISTRLLNQAPTSTGQQLTPGATQTSGSRSGPEGLLGPDAIDGPAVCISVSDTGLGIDPTTRERVFEPFFTTKGPAQGTGLGLAMLYGFVKQSGGTIELESTLGQGTTFHVFLPHCTGVKKSDPFASTAVISGPVSRGDETILLVDCDESVRRVARRILELHGYHVIEAANAGEAYFELDEKSRAIDLLLMSPQLPRVDACEFALRAKQNHPGLSVLAMSGAFDQATLDRFAEATQAHFLSKPLTPERLIDAVREALRHRVPRRSRSYAPPP